MAFRWWKGSGEASSSGREELTDSSTDTDDNDKAAKPNSKAMITRSKPTKTGSFREQEKAPFNQGILIGIKAVVAATGDDMCKAAMKALRHEKGRKKIVVIIAVSESEVKLKDENGSETIHSFLRISYIWRHPKNRKCFGYVYGTPDTGHGFVAFEIALESADALVDTIHQIFHAAYCAKQQEVDRAKKRQADSTSNGSGDSWTGSIAEARIALLESQLAQQTKMMTEMARSLAEMTKPMQIPETPWADFEGQAEERSSASRSSLVFNPWGSESAPTSLHQNTQNPLEIARLCQEKVLAPPVASVRTMNQQTNSRQDPAPANAPTSAEMGYTGYDHLQSDIQCAAANQPSVFDKPLPVPQAPKEKKMTDQNIFVEFVESGLKGIKTGNAVPANLTRPREKPSKKSFPQPLKKMMGGSMAVAPAVTTIDPFYVTPSLVTPDDMGSRNLTEKRDSVPSASTTAPPSRPVLPPRPSILLAAL